MAKEKNSAPEELPEELLAQMHDEPDEALTDEEWEEVLKEEKHMDACGNQAANALVELARVPFAGQKRFREKIYELVRETHNAFWSRYHHNSSKAFAELERNIRAACVASLGLTKRERDHLDRVINRHRRIKRPDGWTHVLRLMSEACSELTGKNPYPHAKSRSGRGRRRGDIKDYPLNHFVRSLTIELRDCGGRLTLDVKGQRGSWIKALDMLRPLLPAGFIPKAPPSQRLQGG